VLGDLEFLVFLLAGMAIVMIYLSRKSGWNLLSTRYKGRFKDEGETIRFASAKLSNGVFFGNVLKFSFDGNYLYISSFLPFSIFFPALVVPSEDIEIGSNSKRLSYFSIRLIFKKCPRCPVFISKKHAMKLGFTE
jgi:hypothetical protein